MVELPPKVYLCAVFEPRRMDRLEDVRMNEMEALAQEATREPESVWVQRPERRNCGRFGESSIVERTIELMQWPWESCVLELPFVA